MKISKAEYDALPEALKALFKADGDGYSSQFMTKEDVDSEVAGLKASNQKLKEEKQAAKAAAEEAARQRQEEEAKRNRETGNIEALEKSYQEKLAKVQGDFDSYKQTSEKQLHSILVQKEANALASKLGRDNAEVLLPHILSRLTVESGPDGAKTRVLDKDGKPSAHSLEDLETEFRGNKIFSGVIVESEASGAQGARQQNGIQSQPNGIPQTALGANSLTARALEIAKQGGDA